jgi:hypothetical protein
LINFNKHLIICFIFVRILGKEKTLLENTPFFSQLFRVSSMILNFSNLTRCVLTNLCLILRQEPRNFELLTLILKSIEITVINNVLNVEHFFLCPNNLNEKGEINQKNNIFPDLLNSIDPALKKSQQTFRVPNAFELSFRLFTKKIEKINARISPVFISLSRQKTNEILENLNLLFSLNSKEIAIFKKNLKNEIIKKCYKKMIAAGEIEFEQKNKKANENEEFLKEKEHPITVEIDEIFVSFSKNDEVYNYFLFFRIFIYQSCLYFNY